jgi:hypothetical protein
VRGSVATSTFLPERVFPFQSQAFPIIAAVLKVGDARVTPYAALAYARTVNASAGQRVRRAILISNAVMSLVRIMFARA